MPFAELMWCFTTAFSCSHPNVLFDRWSQVLHGKAVTTCCHKTVCLMVRVKLAVCVLPLDGQCGHIRFAKAVMWLVLRGMLTSNFDSEVRWCTWVFCFGVFVAVLNCSSKSVALLTECIQAHHKIVMCHALETLCGSFCVCCSSIALCLTGCIALCLTSWGDHMNGVRPQLAKLRKLRKLNLGCGLTC